uniref:PRA1 family protein n=4 Tax=Triticinae TaxID=1648030 RepID=A0A453E5A8_AEGTS
GHPARQRSPPSRRIPNSLIPSPLLDPSRVSSLPPSPFPSRIRPPAVRPSPPATMSKYGTIPTSSSAAAGAPHLGGASPLDFISRAKARGATALATRRPWRELADVHAVGLPPSLGDAYLRVRANLAHFAMNYAIVVLVVVFLSLLWQPISLIVFLVCMVGWLVLYFLRDEPIVLFGRVVGDGVVLAVLAAVTLILLLLTGATTNILTSLLIGFVLVVVHAALHKAEDNVDEEVGRWYAPVPAQ